MSQGCRDCCRPTPRYVPPNVCADHLVELEAGQACPYCPRPVDDVAALARALGAWRVERGKA